MQRTDYAAKSAIKILGNYKKKKKLDTKLTSVIDFFFSFCFLRNFFRSNIIT